MLCDVDQVWPDLGLPRHASKFRAPELNQHWVDSGLVRPELRPICVGVDHFGAVPAKIAPMLANCGPGPIKFGVLAVVIGRNFAHLWRTRLIQPVVLSVLRATRGGGTKMRPGRLLAKLV